MLLMGSDTELVEEAAARIQLCALLAMVPTASCSTSSGTQGRRNRVLHMLSERRVSIHENVVYRVSSISMHTR